MVQTRLHHEGLEAVAYEDGSRLLRSRGHQGRAPGRGAAGLLTLASSRLGDSIGRLACDPYRDGPIDGRRHLVLLVDTSGSIVSAKRVPSVLVCAAGAALSALAHGFPVTVANFSRETLFYRTSRSSEVIYDAISRIQGETTNLPRASLIPLQASGAPDYLLVSDAAIHNLKQVLPDYRMVLEREPRSRALLFALGEGQSQEVAALEEAGFRADRVEGPGRDFRRFVARSLEGLLPPMRHLPALRRLRRLASRAPADKAPAPRP